MYWNYNRETIPINFILYSRLKLKNSQHVDSKDKWSYKTSTFIAMIYYKGLLIRKGHAASLSSQKQLCMSAKLYIIIKIKMQISNLIVSIFTLYL